MEFSECRRTHTPFEYPLGKPLERNFKMQRQLMVLLVGCSPAQCFSHEVGRRDEVAMILIRCRLCNHMNHEQVPTKKSAHIRESVGVADGDEGT